MSVSPLVLFAYEMNGVQVVLFLSFDFKSYWSLLGRNIEFIISVHIYIETFEA